MKQGISGRRGPKEGKSFSSVQPLERSARGFGLSPRECVLWRWVIDQLPEGFLVVADRFNLKMFCVVWCMWEDNVKALASAGHSYVDGKGTRRRTPESLMEKELSARMVTLGKQLGFSAGSQIRLRNAVKVENEPSASPILVLDGDRKLAGGRR